MVKVRPEHLRRLETNVFVNSYAYSPELYPLSILLEREAGEIIKEAVAVRSKVTTAMAGIEESELREKYKLSLPLGPHDHSYVLQMEFMQTQVQRLDHLIK